MITHKIIKIAAKPYGAHLITDDLMRQIALKGSGIVHFFIQHTSAALALNENASPDVLMDVGDFFTHLVPEGKHYRHKEEGADDMPAHIKSILCSTSLSIPFQENRLMLGIWQGIYLMEFRKNAGPRSIVVSQVF
jgi:secondary thiamine-phosphate synthase enzyme